MDDLVALGAEMPKIIVPTAQLYAPLLAKNAERIQSTKRTTYKYGSHARHQLDVYYPSDESTHDTAPVLLFVYGGGMVQGDRVMQEEPFSGLVYTNLGHYFAEQCGYITVILDYRLVSKHDAKFPTGGEDVGLAVQWIKDHLSGDEDPRDLYLLGHATGGEYILTWLFAPPFETAVSPVTGNLRRQPVKLRGVMLLNVLYEFTDVPAEVEEVLQAYYGDRRKQDCPMGLLKDLQKRSTEAWPLGTVEFLAIESENDPESFRDSTGNFLGQWLSSGPTAMKDKITYRELAHHNHVSPPWALGTGLDEHEAWAEEVSGFVDSIRRREQLEKDIKILQESIQSMPLEESQTEEDPKAKQQPKKVES